LKILFLLALVVFTGIISVNDAFAQDPEDYLILSNYDSKAGSDNTFYGSQVIEVIIDDPSISDTTILQTEPVVTVNGRPLRMAQATDGKWYAYFANSDSAKLADKYGIDFGEFCSSTTSSTILGTSFSSTEGVAIPKPFVGKQSSTNGNVPFVECTNGQTENFKTNIVLKNPPTLVSSQEIPNGQIGINENFFPIIQLITVSRGGNAVVQYVYEGKTIPNKVVTKTLQYDHAYGGGDLTLKFFSKTNGLDLEIKAPYFNIDPTTRDSWTFNTKPDTPGLYYHVFDENGNPTNNFSEKITPENIKEMGLAERDDAIMRIYLNEQYITRHNPPSIIKSKDNGIQKLTSTGTSPSSKGMYSITFIESVNDSKIFTNIDDNGYSNFGSKDDFNRFESTECAFPEPISVRFGAYNDKSVYKFNSIKCLWPAFYPLDEDGYDRHGILSRTRIAVDEDKSIELSTSLDRVNGNENAIVDTKPLHGEITGVYPDFTYTPGKDYVGSDNFIMKFTSGGFTKNVEYRINVIGTQDIPQSNAGLDQSVNVNDVVHLDGSKSKDVDGDTLTYSWIQTAGYPVTLTDKTIVNPQFTAPSNVDRLTFMLTVSDGSATSVPGIVNVYVGAPVPEPTPPPTPQLSSSSTSTTTTLSWKVEDDGGSPITNYVVEFKKSDSTQWEIYEQLDDSTSLGLTGLEFEQSYDFRVYAKNLIGDSEVSDIITIVLKEEKVTVEPEPTVEPRTIQSKVSQIKDKVSEIKRLLEILRNG
jgi:hypothetical protein